MPLGPKPMRALHQQLKQQMKLDATAARVVSNDVIDLARQSQRSTTQFIRQRRREIGKSSTSAAATSHPSVMETIQRVGLLSRRATTLQPQQRRRLAAPPPAAVAATASLPRCRMLCRQHTNNRCRSPSLRPPAARLPFVHSNGRSETVQQVQVPPLVAYKKPASVVASVAAVSPSTCDADCLPLQMVSSSTSDVRGSELSPSRRPDDPMQSSSSCHLTESTDVRQLLEKDNLTAFKSSTDEFTNELLWMSTDPPPAVAARADPSERFETAVNESCMEDVMLLDSSIVNSACAMSEVTSTENVNGATAAAIGNKTCMRNSDAKPAAAAERTQSHDLRWLKMQNYNVSADYALGFSETPTVVGSSLAQSLTTEAKPETRYSTIGTKHVSDCHRSSADDFGKGAATGTIDSNRTSSVARHSTHCTGRRKSSESSWHRMSRADIVHSDDDGVTSSVCCEKARQPVEEMAMNVDGQQTALGYSMDVGAAADKNCRSGYSVHFSNTPKTTINQPESSIDLPTDATANDAQHRSTARGDAGDDASRQEVCRRGWSGAGVRNGQRLRTPVGNQNASELAMQIIARILDNIDSLQSAIGQLRRETTQTDAAIAEDDVSNYPSIVLSSPSAVSNGDHAVLQAWPAVSASTLDALGTAVASFILSLELASYADRTLNVSNDEERFIKCHDNRRIVTTTADTRLLSCHEYTDVEDDSVSVNEAETQLNTRLALSKLSLPEMKAAATQTELPYTNDEWSFPQKTCAAHFADDVADNVKVTSRYCHGCCHACNMCTDCINGGDDNETRMQSRSTEVCYSSFFGRAPEENSRQLASTSSSSLSSTSPSSVDDSTTDEHPYDDIGFSNCRQRALQRTYFNGDDDSPSPAAPPEAHDPAEAWHRPLHDVDADCNDLSWITVSGDGSYQRRIGVMGTDVGGAINGDDTLTGCGVVSAGDLPSFCALGSSALGSVNRAYGCWSMNRIQQQIDAGMSHLSTYQQPPAQPTNAVFMPGASLTSTDDHLAYESHLGDNICTRHSFCMPYAEPVPMRLMDERRTYRDAINEAIDGYIEETEVSLQSQQLYQQQTFFIEVDRSSSTLIEDLIELYRSVPNGFLHAPLKISFLGEAGVDNGALTREFFHLVFDSIIAGGVASGSGGGSRRGAFEGRSGHLLPAVDHLLTEQRVFWLVGVLSAQAVHNGCRGLPGLCAATRRFLGAAGARVGAVPELERLIDAEDVADLELRSLIVKDEAQMTDDELGALRQWLDESKFTLVLNPSTRLRAVRHLLRFYVFDSRMSQLQAIAEGVDELGWRHILDDVDLDALFPSGFDRTSLDEFFSAVRISNVSDTSVLAQRARKFFVRYCTELEAALIDGLSLSDLLVFFTGDPYIPAGRLTTGVAVVFASPDDAVDMPRARTCSYELVLPVSHVVYETFRDAMSRALRFGAVGFGLA